MRDGGRIIDCQFDNRTIRNITRNLSLAGIDIIEIGFLRSRSLVDYKGDSTFFTDVYQIKPFIPNNSDKTMFVAFIDFGMFDFSTLERCENNFISGIRVGFTKKQFTHLKEEIREALLYVKKQGYKLFVQGVNTLDYSDRELLDVIDLVNEIEPYSYGIVDTYGAMYLEDIIHIYNLVDHNLKLSISIDIHSHNNFQSSFAFAQEIIRHANGKRNIIFDSTLNGMGKCAGNLNTEILADFMTRKKGSDYDIDKILDTIDCFITPIKVNYEWGYSVPAFMAGIYKSHPNNIMYLTEKYRLNSKDIKYIISKIDEDVRQRYDYDNIQRIYKEYNANLIEDNCSIEELSSIFGDKNILVVVPGRSIDKHMQKIKDYINMEHPLIISVNFSPNNVICDYYFYANAIHWKKICAEINHNKCILTSNIHENIENAYLVNYSSLIYEDSKLYDNSTIMLLNLLKKLEVRKIALAGFDGFKVNSRNYIDDSFLDTNLMIKERNSEVKKLFNDFRRKVSEKIQVEIITPSIYDPNSKCDYDEEVNPI